MIPHTSSSSAISSAPASERGHHQVVFGDLIFIDGQVALLAEHPGHRAVLSQVPVVLGEEVANFGHHPIFVVGQGLDYDRHTTTAVAFVDGRFVGRPGKLTGSLLDGAIDVRRGHVFRFCRQDRSPQPGIAGFVASSVPGGDGDFPDQLGEGLTPGGVILPFFALYGRPFGVSGHGSYLEQKGHFSGLIGPLNVS